MVRTLPTMARYTQQTCMVPHHPCGRYLPYHESHRSQLSTSHDRRCNTFTNSYAHVVSRHPLTRNCSAIISDLKLNMTVLSLTATSTGSQPCQRTGDMCVEEVLRQARRLNRCLFHQPKQGFRLSALRETIVLRSAVIDHLGLLVVLR